jgi:hypothetical protein
MFDSIFEIFGIILVFLFFWFVLSFIILFTLGYVKPSWLKMVQEKSIPLQFRNIVFFISMILAIVVSLFLFGYIGIAGA